MEHIKGIYESGHLSWEYKKGTYSGTSDIRIEFELFTKSYRRVPVEQMLSGLERLLKRDDIAWCSRASEKAWDVNLDSIRQNIPDLNLIDWFRGKISVIPSTSEIDAAPKEFSGFSRKGVGIHFLIKPQMMISNIVNIDPPIEIQESLKRFREDYPDHDKVAFVMMQFGATPLHDAIFKSVENTLKTYEINAIKADSKEYHEDLFINILTYIYGAAFGIAVFERLESDDFNPNVSLEVGYMMALRKPVCLLKDKTLTKLHTDLVGKLYRHFDPQSPDMSIPKVLAQWLKDKGLVKVSMNRT